MKHKSQVKEFQLLALAGVYWDIETSAATILANTLLRLGEWTVTNGLNEHKIICMIIIP